MGIILVTNDPKLLEDTNGCKIMVLHANPNRVPRVLKI